MNHKEVVVVVSGLFLLLLISVLWNMHLATKVEILTRSESVLMQIVRGQDLEIAIRKEACDAAN